MDRLSAAAEDATAAALGRFEDALADMNALTTIFAPPSECPPSPLTAMSPHGSDRTLSAERSEEEQEAPTVERPLDLAPPGLPLPGVAGTEAESEAESDLPLPFVPQVRIALPLRPKMAGHQQVPKPSSAVGIVGACRPWDSPPRDPRQALSSVPRRPSQRGVPPWQQVTASAAAPPVPMAAAPPRPSVSARLLSTPMLVPSPPVLPPLPTQAPPPPPPPPPRPPAAAAVPKPKRDNAKRPRGGKQRDDYAQWHGVKAPPRKKASR